MKNKVLTIILLLLSSFVALSQELVVNDHVFDGNFFPTVIAGVILALAFQFILTSLSVAIGISSLGNLKQQYAEATQNLSKSGEENETKDHLQEIETPLAVKITTGFGIWSVLTTCIALFLSTMVALNLNGIVTQEAVIANSLVIWALFFIILFYFETKIAGTLVGGLIATATAGLKASGSAVQNLFASSDAKKIDHIITTAVDRIRTEISDIDTSGINRAIENFTDKLDHKIPDYNDLKKDLMAASKSSVSLPSSAKWIAIEKVLLKIIDNKSNLTGPDAQQKIKEAKQTLAQMKKAYQKGDDSVDGIKNVVSQFSELDKKEINQKIDDFKSQLSKALPDDFEKQAFKNKLNKIINDPKVLVQAINDKFANLNRESIIAYLDKNTSIEKSNIEHYADQVEAVVDKIAAKFDKENEQRLVARMGASVENFFNTTGRTELRYDELKNDFVQIIDDPKESLAVIKSRLSQMDFDSVRAIITNNKYLDQAHIDKVIQSYDDAKSYVSDKITRIEEKAAQKYKMLKRKAVIQSEHARKTASVAAWWLVITAVASAAAAVTGGLI